jgi:hypothetical protein
VLEKRALCFWIRKRSHFQMSISGFGVLVGLMVYTAWLEIDKF